MNWGGVIAEPSEWASMAWALGGPALLDQTRIFLSPEFNILHHSDTKLT